MKNIAVSTSSFGKYDSSLIECCKQKGYAVYVNPYGRKLNSEELLKFAGDAVGLIAGTEPISEEILTKLPFLKVISRCGVGLDNIDLTAAKRLGIKVFNTPDAPTVAVAELVIGLIFNLLRKINQMDKAVKERRWEKLMGNLLYDKKFGIVGFGRIGQKVAGYLALFGAKLAYYDIEPKPSLFACERKKFEEILSWADAVILTLSPPTGCGYIIGDRELELMRRNSLIINVSRGGIVDEKAIYNAIKEGRLSGAALDVFEEEPYKGPLIELNNVILTPHIGSYAREARVKMEKQALENILNGLED